VVYRLQLSVLEEALMGFAETFGLGQAGDAPTPRDAKTEEN
jgi:hypothetical protein